MATTPKIGGINTFIWQYAASTYSLVGCATNFSIDRSNNSIKVACQINATAVGKEYGSQDNKGSIAGLRFDWDSGDEADQFTYKDFKAAMESQEKVTFRVGASSTVTSTKLDSFTAVIASLTEDTSLSGDSQGTYSVSLEIDGAITEITI